jgi:hypothetical protein
MPYITHDLQALKELLEKQDKNSESEDESEDVRQKDKLVF